jgi:hypothetical protein
MALLRFNSVSTIYAFDLHFQFMARFLDLRAAARYGCVAPLCAFAPYSECTEPVLVPYRLNRMDPRFGRIYSA